MFTVFFYVVYTYIVRVLCTYICKISCSVCTYIVTIRLHTYMILKYVVI